MGNTQSLSKENVDEYLQPTTEYSLKVLRHYFERYRLFVKHNPLLVSEIESALYWISYLLAATKFHNSRIVSELLKSCSSLLTLFNDNLLRDCYGLNSNLNAWIRSFHLTLQFIEYVQVFLELTAVHLYGRYGKWLMISIIEMIKAIIRLLLLFYYQQGLTHKQYLNPLNRINEYEQFRMKQKLEQRRSHNQLKESSVVDDDDDDESDEQHFRLQSSGRVIRHIGQAPPKDKRTWITPQQQQLLQRLMQKNHRHCPTVTQLNQRRLIGELLHILRPVIHLTTGAIVGGIEDRWTPYLVSLGFDVLSLRLLRGNSFSMSYDSIGLVMNCNNIENDNNDSVGQVDEMWNWNERLEIQRRYLMLLMYLLRSPFYDQYTKQRLLRLISLFANYIPLFGRLCRPLIGVLPQWQQVYFNIWN